MAGTKPSAKPKFNVQGIGHAAHIGSQTSGSQSAYPEGATRRLCVNLDKAVTRIVLAVAMMTAISNFTLYTIPHPSKYIHV